MIELFVSAFITFFVVIDPPGCAPIFAGLTAGTTATHRRVMATRAVLVAAVILFGFALFGEALLRALGISLNAFKIAGGIILFLVAIDMLQARRSGTQEVTEERLEGAEKEEVGVTPLGIPMLAGPGARSEEHTSELQSH